MPRIDRLEVHALGPFEHLDLVFGEHRSPGLADLHLFTGQNGTGKSTLLHVLAAFFAPESASCHQDVIARRKGSAGDWYAGLALPPVFYLAREAGSQIRPQWMGSMPTVALNLLTPRRSGLRFVGLGPTAATVQEIVAETRSQNREEDWKAARHTFGAFAYSGVRNPGNPRVEAVKNIDTSPFTGALTFAAGDAGTLLQWVANSLSKGALYEQRKEQARAEDVSKARAQIERAVGEIVGADVRFELEIDPVEVFFRVGGEKVPFGVLPDGLKSILSWLADLIMRLDRIPWAETRPITEQPFVLLLDEVDVHLHPAWQRKILPVTQRLFPNAQIFATTHSPFVVSSLTTGWIYRLEQDKSGLARLAQSYAAEAGNSVDWVLDEVFGVPERFDLDTERHLASLRDLRNQVLATRAAAGLDAWVALVAELMQRGAEVQAIVAAEDRQLRRLLRQADERATPAGDPA